MTINEPLYLIAIVWLLYFVIHSVTASLRIKSWVASKNPDFMPAYRLCFNILATVLLMLPLYLSYQSHGSTLWSWQGYEKIIANSLAYLSIIGFIWSLKYYDGLEFLGLRQLMTQEKSVLDQEHFQLSPFHRHVRHPWYFFALLYLWVQEMNPAWLLNTVMITLYFIIGSRLEEKKLLIYHGDIYQRYMKKVPGLLPLPWRYLSSEEAEALIQKQNL